MFNILHKLKVHFKEFFIKKETIKVKNLEDKTVPIEKPKNLKPKTINHINTATVVLKSVDSKKETLYNPTYTQKSIIDDDMIVSNQLNNVIMESYYTAPQSDVCIDNEIVIED